MASFRAEPAVMLKRYLHYIAAVREVCDRAEVMHFLLWRRHHGRRPLALEARPGLSVLHFWLILRTLWRGHALRRWLARFFRALGGRSADPRQFQLLFSLSSGRRRRTGRHGWQCLDRNLVHQRLGRHEYLLLLRFDPWRLLLVLVSFAYLNQSQQ